MKVEVKFNGDTRNAEAGIEVMSKKVHGLGGVISEAIADLSPDQIRELSEEMCRLADIALQAQGPEVLARGLYDIWNEE